MIFVAGICVIGFSQSVPPYSVCVHAKSLQLCPMDCSLPGSTVHGILQARILEWVATPSSMGSSQPKDQTCVSSVYMHWQGDSLPLVHLGSHLGRQRVVVVGASCLRCSQWGERTLSVENLKTIIKLGRSALYCYHAPVILNSAM